MVRFSRRIVFIGFGSVARCTLPILLAHVEIDPRRITIVDFNPDGPALAPWLARGVILVKDRIAPDSLGRILGPLVSAGDLLIDLAWNIHSGELIDWCHGRGVMYANTAVELWDPYDFPAGTHPTELTLYARHMELRRIRDRWREPGPTAIVEHGANPGLISHFTKQGLLDIASTCLDERVFTGAEAEQVADHAANRSFAHLAQALGVKVVQCTPTGLRSSTTRTPSQASTTPASMRPIPGNSGIFSSQTVTEGQRPAATDPPWAGAGPNAVGHGVPALSGKARVV
jgi:homospermidine synthase